MCCDSRPPAGRPGMGRRKATATPVRRHEPRGSSMRFFPGGPKERSGREAGFPGNGPVVDPAWGYVPVLHPARRRAA
jgi:hypothetical protein